MHLAAAVGTPIVALFGSSDPRRTGPLGVPARILWRPDLPCVPCLKNRCPRSGRGTFLPDAVNECLHLLEIEPVLDAIEALWARRN
jgi:ADP-heptose:LPS heptosyltransferase